eukprot:226478-Chlamydomonas_euryale.AAC.6
MNPRSTLEHSSVMLPSSSWPTCRPPAKQSARQELIAVKCVHADAGPTSRSNASGGPNGSNAGAVSRADVSGACSITRLASICMTHVHKCELAATHANIKNERPATAGKKHARMHETMYAHAWQARMHDQHACITTTHACHVCMAYMAWHAWHASMHTMRTV